MHHPHIPRPRILLLLLLVAAACLLATPLLTERARSADGDVVLVGAGDIASCANDYDEATAALLDGIAGTVYTLGDNVYDHGTAAEFATCYDPTWGRHKARTRPTSGNHEYETGGGAPYFAYFGAAAGDPTKGYYSYDAGSFWHVVVLNSECAQVGGCNAGSPQELWLRADLAANASKNVLAMWHKPLFSSGSHGGEATVAPLYAALYDYGAELVLSGHEHDYERFAPQTSTGAADATYGVREIVVGTGGRSHTTFGTIKPNSEIRNDATYGVLKLTLQETSYTWQFVPVAGSTFTDSGTTAVHGAPGAATATATATATRTSTATPTRTSTPTRTPTGTPTATASPTRTPTDKATATPTATATSTSSPTATVTATATATDTPTSTSTSTSTPTPTPDPTDTDGDGYSDAREIELGEDPGTYCRIMRADVDGDGSVSILDLPIVAQYFTQSIPPAPTRYNQDADSAISILDLTKMATVFTQPVATCP